MNEKTMASNIRMLRKRRKMTLQDMASRTGLNKSYLSRIERGLKSPPFSTINQIAGALGVALAYLIRENLSNQEDSRICITKKGEGDIAQTGNPARGYVYEALATDKSGKNMIPYIITVSPDEEQTFKHEGEEILYVLEGKMAFSFDGTTYIVEEGDCIYLESGVPHSGKSISEGKTRLMAVIYNYKRL